MGKFYAGRGFTLVEVLVSSALLVLVATSFFYITKTSLKFQEQAEQKLKDAYALQAKMEELRGLSFEDLKRQPGVIVIEPGLVEVKAGEIYTLRAE